MNIEILKVSPEIGILVLLCQRCFINHSLGILKWGCNLQGFPIVSKLDPAVYGPPESAITKDLIQQELSGITVEEVSMFIIAF